MTINNQQYKLNNSKFTNFLESAIVAIVLLVSLFITM